MHHTVQATVAAGPAATVLVGPEAAAVVTGLQAHGPVAATVSAACRPHAVCGP